MNFEELCLDTRILRAITEMGFEQASPIQAQAIPVAIEGKDMIGQAQTGTGKTAAFGIPLLQRVDPHNKKLQAVVLCPTRELAIQCANEMRKFAKFMHRNKGTSDIRRSGHHKADSFAERWDAGSNRNTGTSYRPYKETYIKDGNSRNDSS